MVFIKSIASSVPSNGTLPTLVYRTAASASVISWFLRCNICCTRGIAWFKAANPWLMPARPAAKAVGSTSGATGSSVGSSSTPWASATLGLPLPLLLHRGAGTKLRPERTVHPHQLLLQQEHFVLSFSFREDKTENFKTQQGTDITRNSRSNDDNSIFINLFTEVVQKKT